MITSDFEVMPVGTMRRLVEALQDIIEQDSCLLADAQETARAALEDVRCDKLTTDT